MGGRGRRREQSQIDVPADWESDFAVTSQALTRHVWDICSVPGMSQGHGRHSLAHRSSPPPKKGIPSKKR